MYITDYRENIQAVNLCALSAIGQLDNCSVNTVIGNEGASTDRAEKCSISSHCYHVNIRKRVALQATKQCTYIQ